MKRMLQSRGKKKYVTVKIVCSKLHQNQKLKMRGIKQELEIKLMLHQRKKQISPDRWFPLSHRCS